MPMRVTSALANKILKKHENEKEHLLRNEQKMMDFHCATMENPDDLRPDYSFKETQERIDMLDQRIMEIKHAINVFNSTTEIADGLTIDQVLIKLPQLQKKKAKCGKMRSVPQKERFSIQGGVIDYLYTSYDPAEAETAYVEVENEITRLQLALDKVNTTVEFEI